MKNVTLKDLILKIEKIKKTTPEAEWDKINIYLGEDDELNGIHTCWFIDEVDATYPDSEMFNQLIDEGHNVRYQNKYILLS